MNQANESDNSPSAAPHSQNGWTWKRIDAWIRAVCVVALAVFAIVIFVQFLDSNSTRWLNGDVKQPVESTSDLTLAAASDSNADRFLADFVNGGWNFGDSKWCFATHDVNGSEVPQYLHRLPGRIRQRDPDFDDETFVELFEAIGAKREKLTVDAPENDRSDFGIWRATYGGIQAYMLTNDQSVVQVLRFVLPPEEGRVNSGGVNNGVNGGKLTIVEMTPTIASQQPGRKNGFLLPLCGGAQRIGFRRSASRKMTSSIIEYQGRKVDMLSHWDDNGWQVTPMEPAGNSGNKFQCSKEDDLVEATFIERETGFNLFLVRVAQPDL